MFSPCQILEAVMNMFSLLRLILIVLGVLLLAMFLLLLATVLMRGM